MKNKKILLVIITIFGLTAIIINPIKAQCLSQYLSFDGDDDWIDISNNGPMSNIQNNVSYTIEAWVRRAHTSLPGGMERVYSKDYIFNFRIINDSFRGEIGNSMVAYKYPSDTNWHHIAFIRDITQSTLRLFIDGTLVNSSVDNSSTINNNNAMICIGARNNGIGIYEEWKGDLKFIRVSNISRYSNSFIPNINYTSDNNTLGFWTLDEGSGNVANDLSNNGHNGNINYCKWSSNLISTISNQPTTQFVGINSSAHFIISSTKPNVNYIWQTNGANLGWQNVPSNSNYSGGNSDTITINNVQLSNHNQPFRVIATSGTCKDTSNIAYVKILDTCITNINDTIKITKYDTIKVTKYDTIKVMDTLVINATLSGVSAPNNTNRFIVYPNPAKDHITIDYGVFSRMNGYTLKIVNTLGQTVFSSPINQQSSFINLSTWTGKGMYHVQIFDTQNNMIENRKIVLQ